MSTSLFKTLLMTTTTLVGFLLPMVAFAQLQQFGNVPVANIETGWGDEGLYIHSTQSFAYTGCTGSSFLITPTRGYRKEMENILYIAIVTGRTIDITIDGCYSAGAMNVISLVLHS